MFGYVAPQTIEFDDGAGAVLRIQPLRAPRDENIYECVARNDEGEVSVTAKLAIIRGETHKEEECVCPFLLKCSSLSTGGHNCTNTLLNCCPTFPELSDVNMTKQHGNTQTA